MMKIGYWKRANAKTNWEDRYRWPSLRERLEMNRYDAKCSHKCCQGKRANYTGRL